MKKTSENSPYNNYYTAIQELDEAITSLCCIFVVLEYTNKPIFLKDIRVKDIYEAIDDRLPDEHDKWVKMQVRNVEK